MTDENPGLSDPLEIPDSESGVTSLPFRSLRHFIDHITGKDQWKLAELEDAGLAEPLPFPFLALVGQNEMKLALLIALVNPLVGGVLLIGPRGTGKTTAVRGLVDLLPDVQRSVCYYGCMPEDIEVGGIDAVCPECAQKYAAGEPLTRTDRVRLVELPLNARLEDVIGGVDERAVIHDRMRLRKGILAQADRNLLYIDEVNLLDDDVVDAILDASAQGRYTVRRGPIASTYRARFVLVGSMNPEEGRLRPQIMDRFGLRVVVRGLAESADRMEVYRRVQAYQASPRRISLQFTEENAIVTSEIQVTREMVPEVVLPEEIAAMGLKLIGLLNIDSARAEITLFEAAKSYAALDGRKEVTLQDLLFVTPMALRMRRSQFMEQFFEEREKEETELLSFVDEVKGIKEEGQ
jgi:magnesium chelatase subunit I